MMNKLPNLSPKAFEALSAYIDSQLSPEESIAVEKRLSSSVSYQKHYERIKAMRTAMRALPKHKAPRNFILTRAEAAEAKRGRNWSRAFGLAFSLCAVFLVVLLGYDGLSNGLFAMKKEAPSEASVALYTTDMDESAQTLEPESPQAISARDMKDDSSDQPVLLSWGNPTSKDVMAGGSIEQADTIEENRMFTSQSSSSIDPGETSYRNGIAPEMLTEDGLVKIFLNDPETGLIHICDPIYGCGLGGGGSVESNDFPMTEETEPLDIQSGVHLVDPNRIYYDPVRGNYFLCASMVSCNAQSLVAETNDEVQHENAFPLILGLDHENEGELISASPQFTQDIPEPETAPYEEAYPEQPLTGPCDNDSDHQIYLQDQLNLWLKIGAAGLAILFGIIWLIIRRR